MKLQKHLRDFLATIWVISITAVWYAAVSSVSSWDTLTATMWNDMKTVVDGNTTSLSNLSFSWGYIWIGTANPTANLHVYNWPDWDASVRFRNGFWTSKVLHIVENWWSSGHYGIFVWSDDYTTATFVTKANNVWIWTTTPTTKLDVNGTITATAFDIWYERVVSSAEYHNPWSGSYHIDANCPVWKKVISGWCYSNRAWETNHNTYRDYPLDDDTWRCSTYSSNGSTDNTVYAYAICAYVQ